MNSVWRFSALLTAALAIAPQLAAADDAEPGATGWVFENFGVGLIPPKGWQRAPEGGPGQIVRFVLPERAEHARRLPTGMMTADIEAKRDRTLRQRAEAWAKTIEGEVRDERTALGEDEAIAVVRTTPAKELACMEVVLTARKGYFYSISRYAARPEQHAAAFGEFRRGWKFVSLVAPLKHPGLVRFPIPKWLGVSFEVPVTARPFPVADATKEFKMAIYNYLDDRCDLILQASRLSGRADATLADHAIELGSRIQARLGVTARIRWVPAPGAKSDVLLSDPLRIPKLRVARPGVVPNTVFQYAICSVGDHDAVVLTFTIGSRRSSVTSQYRLIIAQIARTIAARGARHRIGAATSAPRSRPARPNARR